MIDAAIPRAFLAVCLLSFMGVLDQTGAQPQARHAKVVWIGNQRIYIASPESLALSRGDLLTFVFRGKKIAAGEITSVLDGELAVARLISGSLMNVKQLERLEIRSERPALQSPPVMRFGFPARMRFNLLFACGQMTFRTPPSAGAYRTDSLTGHSYRMVRDSGAVVRAPWPDTILVRTFDEAADEEIALERGELDAAMFWPGELSAHVREHPRWQDFLSGTRARGVLAAAWLGPDVPGRASSATFSDSLNFASLNRELFRGDLARWEEAGESPGRTHSRSAAWPSGTARHEVEASCPGHQALERFLNRSLRSISAEQTPALVHVFFLDSPIHEPDSLLRDAAEIVRGFTRAPEPVASDSFGHAQRDSARVAFLFAIRCPLLCAPELRSYVSALGADALVNMLDCRRASSRP